MIESFELWCEPFHEARRINVYLPFNYYETEEKYPVVYMFDGHNLFDDDEAAYGKSWGIGRFLDSWDKQVIVVGVYCSMHGNDRLVEYSPYNYKTTFTGAVKGRGKLTMEWFTSVLKPHIDKSYRTWTHREATAIAGSSMGGLMAYYAVLKYNHIYSKAACISPAFRLSIRNVKSELQKSGELDEDTKIFFSWGTKEDPRGVLGKHIWKLDAMLQERRIDTYCFQHVDGTHSEASWELEIPLWMNFLWK